MTTADSTGGLKADDGNLTPGAIVANRYQVTEWIGRGGMGSVHGGRHIDLGYHVAIKVLHPKYAVDAVARERFAREGKILAGIQSEHVVRVFDVGTLFDEIPYIVMDRLHGEDLSAVLKRRRLLSEQEAVGYVLEAARGLESAHNAGIVHRDVKPGNLFLSRIEGREVVKVVDFGIARREGASTDGGETTLTDTHEVLGSPRYMAPEQITRSKEVDSRADIWSLGMTLYRLLTGTFPFADQSPYVVALFKPVELDPLNRANVSAGVIQVILRCLEKLPEDRFATMEALGAALRQSQLEPTAEDDTGSTTESVIVEVENTIAVSAPRHSRRMPRIVALAVCSVAVVVLAGLGGRRLFFPTGVESRTYPNRAEAGEGPSPPLAKAPPSSSTDRSQPDALPSASPSLPAQPSHKDPGVSSAASQHARSSPKTSSSTPLFRENPYQGAPP